MEYRKSFFVSFDVSTSNGASAPGPLRVVSGADGTELFTVDDVDLRLSSSPPAIGDIDNDGLPEIVVLDDSQGFIIALENDGAHKWTSDPVEFAFSAGPAIADLDEDGTPEIIVGRQVLNADGTIRWTGAAGRGDPRVGPLSVVADVDLDGTPDVVAGNTLYNNDGSIAWTVPGASDGGNAVANFDGDDEAEIVLIGRGQAWLLEHTGEVKWGPISLPFSWGGPPTVADFDADGEPEIGVAGTNRYVVLETDGLVKWTAVTQDLSSAVTGSSVFDFEATERQRSSIEMKRHCESMTAPPDRCCLKRRLAHALATTTRSLPMSMRMGKPSYSSGPTRCGKPLAGVHRVGINVVYSCLGAVMGHG